MASERDRRAAEHREKIQQALRDKRLVIVVGTGVTLSATHPSPSRVTWKGLVLNGLEYLEDECLVQSDSEEFKFYRACLQKTSADQSQLLRACNYLKEELDRHKHYATWLESVFGTLHKHVTNPEIFQTLQWAHHNGAKLLTTNYDDLLEHECKLPYVRRSIADDVRKFERGTLNGVFHLHGSYLDPEDVVLDVVDYYKIGKSDDVQNLMKTYLSHNTVLFVGCGSGLEDPNFDSLRAWAFARGQNIPHHHYLLARTGDNVRYEPLVTLRYGEDFSKLPSFLSALLGSPIDHETPPPTTAKVSALDEVNNLVESRDSAPA